MVNSNKENPLTAIFSPSHGITSIFDIKNERLQTVAHINTKLQLFLYQDGRFICDNLIYSSTRADFTQIQTLKEDGFSCAAVSIRDYLVYGFPEYCKVAIYLW